MTGKCHTYGHQSWAELPCLDIRFQAQLLQCNLGFLDLLGREPTLRRNFNANGQPQALPSGKLRKDFGVEIHPLLRRNIACPAECSRLRWWLWRRWWRRRLVPYSHCGYGFQRAGSSSYAEASYILACGKYRCRTLLASPLALEQPQLI